MNVLEITFKEDVPDLRNSKVVDLITELSAYGVEVFVHDPVVDAAEARGHYGVELLAWNALPQAEAVIVAVAHRMLRLKPILEYASKLAPGGCFIDVKSHFDAEQLKATGFKVWRL